jgi:hypothetical protein
LILDALMRFLPDLLKVIGSYLPLPWMGEGGGEGEQDSLFPLTFTLLDKVLYSALVSMKRTI